MIVVGFVVGYERGQRSRNQKRVRLRHEAQQDDDEPGNGAGKSSLFPDVPCPLAQAIHLPVALSRGDAAWKKVQI